MLGTEDKYPSRFEELRRSLADLKSGVFAIFVDTSSKVSNFAPLIHRDSSDRIARQGQELFSPYYALATKSILALPDELVLMQKEIVVDEIRVWDDVRPERQRLVGVKNSYLGHSISSSLLVQCLCTN